MSQANGLLLGKLAAGGAKVPALAVPLLAGGASKKSKNGLEPAAKQALSFKPGSEWKQDA